MNTIQKMTNLLRVHTFIMREESGGVSLLASKLGVSTRTIFRYMDELRDLGAQIEYDSVNSYFYYKNNFNFSFTFTYARSNKCFD